MRGLSRILGAVYVLEASFGEDRSYLLTVWRCTARGRVESDLKTAARHVAALTVGGQGVISKPVESSVAEKVAADPDHFVWSDSGGMRSFVRSEQLVPLMEELTAASIHPWQVVCAVTPETLAQSVADGVRWKQLAHPSERESSVAQAVARRLMLPLLGLFLFLLSANALVGPRMQARRQELQLRAAAFRQDDTKAANVSAERQRIVQRFAQRLDYAAVCNRIGACVPAGVTLTELWMEPLTERFEEGVSLVRDENTVMVAGRGNSSAAIGQFAQTLAEEPSVLDVRLRAVERTRETGLQFKIEVAL